MGKTTPNLSRLEEEVLRELNVARSSPRVYVGKLEELLAHYDGRMLRLPGSAAPVLTNEGTAAVEEAIAHLRAMPPLPAITQVSAGLCLAARDHANDLAAGAASHYGTTGTAPSARLLRYGKWAGVVAENIAYGGDSAERLVMKLLVDDGVSDRGHRATMLSPEYSFVGIACGPHAVYDLVCVTEYASSYTDFESLHVTAVVPATGAPAAPLLEDADADMFAPLCAGCSKPIVREGTVAVGRQWHKECLVCKDCGVVLEADFFERRGDVFCESDFKKRFIPTECFGCKAAVFSPPVEVCGEKWHSYCLVCSRCKGYVRCGNAAISADGVLFCPPCAASPDAPDCFQDGDERPPLSYSSAAPTEAASVPPPPSQTTQERATAFRLSDALITKPEPAVKPDAACKQREADGSERRAGPADNGSRESAQPWRQRSGAPSDNVPSDNVPSDNVPSDNGSRESAQPWRQRSGVPSDNVPSDKGGVPADNGSRESSQPWRQRSGVPADNGSRESAQPWRQRSGAPSDNGSREPALSSTRAERKSEFRLSESLLTKRESARTRGSTPRLAGKIGWDDGASIADNNTLEGDGQEFGGGLRGSSSTFAPAHRRTSSLSLLVKSMGPTRTTSKRATILPANERMLSAPRTEATHPAAAAAPLRNLSNVDWDSGGASAADAGRGTAAGWHVGDGGAIVRDAAVVGKGTEQAASHPSHSTQGHGCTPSGEHTWPYAAWAKPEARARQGYQAATPHAPGRAFSRYSGLSATHARAQESLANDTVPLSAGSTRGNGVFRTMAVRPQSALDAGTRPQLSRHSDRSLPPSTTSSRPLSSLTLGSSRLASHGTQRPRDPAGGSSFQPVFHATGSTQVHHHPPPAPTPSLASSARYSMTTPSNFTSAKASRSNPSKCSRPLSGLIW